MEGKERPRLVTVVVVRAIRTLLIALTTPYSSVVARAKANYFTIKRYLINRKL